VVLEKTLPKVKDTAYPLCIKGKRACPPEVSHVTLYETVITRFMGSFEYQLILAI